MNPAPRQPAALDSDPPPANKSELGRGIFQRLSTIRSLLAGPPQSWRETFDLPAFRAKVGATGNGRKKAWWKNSFQRETISNFFDRRAPRARNRNVLCRQHNLGLLFPAWSGWLMKKRFSQVTPTAAFGRSPGYRRNNQRVLD